MGFAVYLGVLAGVGGQSAGKTTGGVNERTQCLD